MFLLFFLFSDWLKLSHLRSRIERDIFSRHICSAVTKTSDKLRNKFWGKKNVQKTTFEAAEMMLGPWNQQDNSENFIEIYRIAYYGVSFIDFKNQTNQIQSVGRSQIRLLNLISP